MTTFQKRRRSIMASFKCNMGMNCDFEVKDKDPKELMQIITLHAERTHDMKRPLPADIMEKVNRAIKK
jgi:predicted small metal-binding protein